MGRLLVEESIDPGGHEAGAGVDSRMQRMSECRVRQEFNDEAAARRVRRPCLAGGNGGRRGVGRGEALPLRSGQCCAAIMPAYLDLRALVRPAIDL